MCDMFNVSVVIHQAHHEDISSCDLIFSYHKASEINNVPLSKLKCCKNKKCLETKTVDPTSEGC